MASPGDDNHTHGRDQNAADGRASTWRFSGRRGTPVDLASYQPQSLPPDVQRVLGRIATERRDRDFRRAARPVAASAPPVERREPRIEQAATPPISASSIPPTLPDAAATIVLAHTDSLQPHPAAHVAHPPPAAGPSPPGAHPPLATPAPPTVTDTGTGAPQMHPNDDDTTPATDWNQTEPTSGTDGPSPSPSSGAGSRRELSPSQRRQLAKMKLKARKRREKELAKAARKDAKKSKDRSSSDTQEVQADESVTTSTPTAADFWAADVPTVDETPTVVGLHAPIDTPSFDMAEPEVAPPGLTPSGLDAPAASWLDAPEATDGEADDVEDGAQGAPVTAATGGSKLGRLFGRRGSSSKPKPAQQRDEQPSPIGEESSGDPHAEQVTGLSFPDGPSPVEQTPTFDAGSPTPSIGRIQVAEPSEIVPMPTGMVQEPVGASPWTAADLPTPTHLSAVPDVREPADQPASFEQPATFEPTPVVDDLSAGFAHPMVEAYQPADVREPSLLDSLPSASFESAETGVEIIGEPALLMPIDDQQGDDTHDIDESGIWGAAPAHATVPADSTMEPTELEVVAERPVLAPTPEAPILETPVAVTAPSEVARTRVYEGAPSAHAEPTPQVEPAAPNPRPQPRADVEASFPERPSTGVRRPTRRTRSSAARSGDIRAQEQEIRARIDAKRRQLDAIFAGIAEEDS